MLSKYEEVLKNIHNPVYFEHGGVGVVSSNRAAPTNKFCLQVFEASNFIPWLRDFFYVSYYFVTNILRPGTKCHIR